MYNIDTVCTTHLLEDNTKLSGRSKKPKYFLKIFTESSV